MVVISPIIFRTLQPPLEGEADDKFHPKKRRINYSYIPEDVKKKVVEYAMEHGTRPAARLLNISEGTIRSWKVRGLNRIIPTVTRGRKVTYGKDLDDELFQGLKAMINAGQLVTIDHFSEYAKKKIDERKPELNFKCSRGWIDKFFNRHNLTMSKSAVSKVMHIVERENVILDGDEDEDTDRNVLSESMDELEFTANSSTASSPLLNHSNQSTPGRKRERSDFSEGDGDAPRNSKMSKIAATLQALISSSSNSVDATTSSSDNTSQSQEMEKALHVLSIIEKLDTSVNTVRSEFDPQRRTEVVQYAKQHGTRNAEKKFGVPETTIRFWVKKISQDKKLFGSMSNHSITSATTTAAAAAVREVAGDEETSSSRSDCNSDTTPNNRTGLDSNNNVEYCHNRTATTACNNHDDREMAIAVVATTQQQQLQQQRQQRQHDHEQQVIISEEDGNDKDTCPSQEELQMLVWALHQIQQGEPVSFDGLCDQAFVFVSQENPSSAYSSTRKWVNRFLDTKIGDLLNVTN